MALLSLVFGRLPGLGFKTIGFLPVDVFTEETITFSSEVTENPIETGAVITDHLFNKPTGLRITGTARGSRRGLSYQILQTLHELRQPIFIATGLQTFTNMALTELVIPRTWRNASALEFTAEFRQLRFVVAATAPATSQAPAAGGASDTSSGATNAGKTQAAPASPAASAGAASTTEATGGPGGSFLSRTFLQ
jgi:hypothetical protein